MSGQQNTSIRTWRLVVLLALAAAMSGFSVSAYLLFHNMNSVISNAESRYDSYLLADELRQSSDDLTRMIRTFAATGNKRFEAQFFEVLSIRNGELSRPQGYNLVYWDLLALADEQPVSDGDAVALRDRMIKAGVADNELKLLSLAQTNSDALVALERVAMRAINDDLMIADEHYRQPGESNREMAIRLLHGVDYHQAKVAIMEPINMFLTKLDARTEAVFDRSAKYSQNLFISCVMFSVLTLFLALMAMFLGLRISVAEQRSLAKAFETEKTLRIHSENLARSNTDLENFAYVSSHDLQEPLRKIQVFSERLELKYKSSLDEKGQDYINRIVASASRMRLLIDDLLTFSRVTTTAKPFESVDLNEVMSDVLDDVDLKGGKLNHPTLPSINADQTQMRQLFQNLIANSVKFKKEAEPLVIDIRATLDEVRSDDGEQQEICKLIFEDNGIGFDPEYRDRIFEVFERLHGRSKYAGTGIGLATCKKIVERHCGIIEADGSHMGGAKFTITLPLKPMAPGKGAE